MKISSFRKKTRMCWTHLTTWLKFCLSDMFVGGHEEEKDKYSPEIKILHIYLIRIGSSGVFHLKIKIQFFWKLCLTYHIQKSIVLFQMLIITVRNEVSKVMFLQASVCPGGGAVCHIACYTLPCWQNFFTHACENITSPQLLLRAVNIRSNL